MALQIANAHSAHPFDASERMSECIMAKCKSGYEAIFRL